MRWLTLFLDRVGAGDADATAFWLDVTGTSLSSWRGEGRFATFLPTAGPAGADAHLRVQRVDDGPGGCHLDLHVDESVTTVADVAERAVSLGARMLAADDDGGLVVLTSPGGFGFCCVRWKGEAVVPAAAGPVPVLADQLCLDVPEPLWENECAFWAALTGWPVTPRAMPEFRRLEVPWGAGLHVLLQRRLDAAPDDVVTGHPDLACLQRTEAVVAHVARGARVVREGPVWTTLTDPAGHPYCITDRDPATGRPPG